MYAYELAYDSFVLLQADWSVEQAQALIDELEPTHVIVRRAAPQAACYLLGRARALYLLAGGGQATLDEALHLDRLPPTPLVDAYDDAFDIPARAIIVEEGDIAGFFDEEDPMPGDTMMGSAGGGSFRGDGELESTGPVGRYLDTEFPEQVQVGQTASLLVWLSIDAGSSRGLPLAAPLGAAVDVIVQAKRGFELTEAREGRLVVEAGETLPLQFKLKATQVGSGLLRVLAFQRGQPLGALTLAPRVVAEEVPPDEIQAAGQSLAPAGVRQPDLSLLILEDTIDGRPGYGMRLLAADPNLGITLAPFAPRPFRKDPQAYFREFFEDIEKLPLRTAEQRAVAQERLVAKGAHLLEELFPEELQTLLWSLRDRIQTVQIQSEEPWVPWELAVLQGEVDGEWREGPFLCEVFAVSRWLPQVEHRPALSLNNVALVVPHDSGLAHAAAERDYVLSLAGNGRAVEPVAANYLALRKALASGSYDGWHFTGHGSFRDSDPNRSGLSLEDRARLTPEDLSGKVRNLGRGRPLVFLNACQTGQQAMSLTDVGGFAAKFLRVGAAAFVGAQWSIGDEAAHAFARAFYERLLQAGQPIGQAVRESRLQVKAAFEGDPTWLAYTLFADPLARVQP